MPGDGRRRTPSATAPARSVPPIIRRRVCDNVHPYGGRHPRRLPRPRAPRGDGLSPARPRRAQRRQRADALPGRARRDQPDADRRRPDRRAASTSASPSSCASTRAARSASCAPARPPLRRRRRPPLRGPHPAAARPARRGLPPHARSPAPAPAAPATRRCTSPARARPPSSSAARVTLRLRRRAPRARHRRLRDLRRRPSPPLREPRRGGGASCWPSCRRGCAAHEHQTLFDKIWAAHEVAPGLLYIDLHLVHEVTSPQAFDGLRLAGPQGPPPRPHARHRRPQRARPTARRSPPASATSSRACRSRRSSATARSSASRSTRSAPTARASCT